MHPLCMYEAIGFIGDDDHFLQVICLKSTHKSTFNTLKEGLYITLSIMSSFKFLMSDVPWKGSFLS